MAETTKGSEHGAPDQFAEQFGYDNPEWYRQLLVHFRYGLNRRNYPLIADMVTGFLNENLTFPRFADGLDDSTLDRDVASLRDHGFCRLGKILGPAEIQEARAAMEGATLVAYREKSPGKFSLSTVPAGVNIADLEREDVLSTPHLAELANHPGILARVEKYLGAPPTIQHYIAWWSLAGQREASGPQMFHEDRACYRFLKLFVYLTDVDQGAGPHVYIRGSGSMRLRDEMIASLEKRKKGLGKIGHQILGKVRASDEEMAAIFGEDRFETFTGAAGEAFLVDTSGYHKGMPPKSENRLIFQTLYTLLPTIRDKVAPMPYPGFFRRLLRSEQRIKEPALRYINRLVIDDF
jgi:hypothetical protein